MLCYQAVSQTGLFGKSSCTDTLELPMVTNATARAPHVSSETAGLTSAMFDHPKNPSILRNQIVDISDFVKVN